MLELGEKGGDVKVFLGILLLWDEQFIPETKKSELMSLLQLLWIKRDKLGRH